MRYSLRFIIPLILVLAAVAYGVVPLVDKLTLKWFSRDIDMRAQLIATTIDEPLAALMRAKDKTKIAALFGRVTQDERLFALGLCDAFGALVYKTQMFTKPVDCEFLDHGNTILELPAGALHVAAYTVRDETGVQGKLVLVHDMGFVQRRSQDTKRYVFYLFAGLGVVISLITVLIAQVSWRGWVSGLRALSKGEGLIRPLSNFATSPELKPIVKDLRELIRDIETDRRARVTKTELA